MGYLKSISIYDDAPSFLGRVPRSVEDHFVRHLHNCKIPSVSQINIRVSDHKPIGTINYFASILEYYGELDKEIYCSLKSNYDKKSFIIDTLFNNLTRLFSSNGWDSSRINEAYRKCLKESLKNEWFFKNKLFQSPDRKYFFGLLNHFDIDNFEISEVLFDSNRLEIARRRIFVDNTDSFRIASASWNDSSDEFSYKFDGPKKIFSATIEDLINGNAPTFPSSLSEYFK